MSFRHLEPRVRFAYSGYGGYGGSMRHQTCSIARKIKGRSIQSDGFVDFVARVRPPAAPGEHVAPAPGAPGALRLPGLRWFDTAGGRRKHAQGRTTFDAVRGSRGSRSPGKANGRTRGTCCYGIRNPGCAGCLLLAQIVASHHCGLARLGDIGTRANRNNSGRPGLSI